MKNKNILKISLVLTTLFAVLLFVGKDWCQNNNNANLSTNNVSNLTFIQSSKGNSQRLVLKQTLSNSYIDNKNVSRMKEVQIAKYGINQGTNDSSKTHRDTLSAFKEYYGVGLPHVMDSNGTFGGLISLDDGSLWVIDPRDIISAMYWDQMAIIFVQQNNDPFSMGYNYVLINNNNDEAVHAMYIGGR